MATWIANLKPSHIRRSPEAIAACRALLLLEGASMTDEQAIESAVEVILCHTRLVTLTGRITEDARAAFVVAGEHTMTEREYSGD